MMDCDAVVNAILVLEQAGAPASAIAELKIFAEKSRFDKPVRIRDLLPMIWEYRPVSYRTLAEKFYGINSADVTPAMMDILANRIKSTINNTSAAKYFVKSASRELGTNGQPYALVDFNLQGAMMYARDPELLLADEPEPARETHEPATPIEAWEAKV